MQFLKITNKTKLSDIAEIVGERNTEAVLVTNNLSRVPNIGQLFIQNCDGYAQTGEAVSWQRKSTVLNTLTQDSDIFEIAALLGESQWKVLSGLGVLPKSLKIPEYIQVAESTSILGNGIPVSKTIYEKVMNSLYSEHHIVSPEIFNEYSNIKDTKIISFSSDSGVGPFKYFHIPWGEVTLYSSISGTSIDIPVYPTEISDSRKANYTTMPDLLYQYEPWQIYQSSGPRINTYKFFLHRDMWTGNHADGKANELIRFCEANLYPEYNGSSVNTATVTLYVHGKSLISGILTDVSVDYEGPILNDGFYAAFTLSLSITEVSKYPLNYNTMRSTPLIGR